VTEKQKNAMQKGRERAVKAAQAAAIKRVKAYRAWLKRDVEVSTLRRRGEPAKREPMPLIPSDHDYKIARDAGVIQ
jgi:hypothetical protein